MSWQLSVFSRCRASLALLAVVAVAAACGGDHEEDDRIQSVVSFGDSLSDAGTYNLQAGARLGQRFTTEPGKVWSERIAQAYDLDLTPHRRVDFGLITADGSGGGRVALGGNAYGEGGARIELDEAGDGVVDLGGGLKLQAQTAMSLKSQIDAYLAQAKKFDKTQLVLVQGGANDFFSFLESPTLDPAEAPAYAEAMAVAMAAQLQRLVDAGATRVLYSNMPDLSMTPEIRAAGVTAAGLAHFLSDTYNTLVASAVKDMPIVVFDTASMMGGVMSSPADYGLTNVDVPACAADPLAPSIAGALSLMCTTDTLVEPDADQTYFFADGVHPTDRGHQLWAQFAGELAKEKVGK